MNVELSELRSFLALAEALHYRVAAERLGVSQPALTKQIQRLEAKLGGSLFRRHTRGVTLAEAGEVLRERATRLLAEAEEVEIAARRAMRGETGELRVGVGLAVLAAGLPEALREFRKRYPSVHVSVRDMGSHEQVAALRERAIDVGFVRMPVEAEGLRVRPVMEERLEMVSSSASARSLRDWAEAPFVVLSRATSASYYDHVLAVCREAGFAPRIVQEANQLYTVLNLVRAGVGVSLAPATAKRMRVPGIRFRATGVRGAAWQIGMARREEKEEVVERFAAMVRRELKV